MQLCRFYLPKHGDRLGLVIAGNVCDLTASGRPVLATFSTLLQASVARPIEALLKDVHLPDLPDARDGGPCLHVHRV